MDSLVKPLSSLAPMDLFCKRSAKDSPLVRLGTPGSAYPRGLWRLGAPGDKV